VVAAAAYRSRTCSRSSLEDGASLITEYPFALTVVDAAECSRLPSMFVNVCQDGRMLISPMPTGAELPLLTECCTPVAGEVIQPSQAEILASGFKALADPARLRLISLVAAHEGAEACVCELTDPVGLS
jgi:hypothetical protein